MEINFLAVLCAAVVAMFVGWLWYGPLFGKQWMALMGMTPERMEAGKQTMMRNYGLMFVGSLVMAFVLHHSLVYASYYLQVQGVSAGLMAGFWNWFGFVAPVTLGSVLWEGKPWKLWVLNNGYYFVTLLLMGVILASWV